MNIKQAKEQIQNAITAYFTKDDFGNYILPVERQRPIFLMGPPGIGKTCAARLVLEAAKKSPGTPFRSNAPFIEMDATCVRFDERAIADPLIGSVHDPIYQGAGPLGVQGVPQPKPGAVTKAHGGVLFLDEIGELHPIQMNKLLKVLEEKKVRRLGGSRDTPFDVRIVAAVNEALRAAESDSASSMQQLTGGLNLPF